MIIFQIRYTAWNTIIIVIYDCILQGYSDNSGSSLREYRETYQHIKCEKVLLISEKVIQKPEKVVFV